MAFIAPMRGVSRRVRHVERRGQARTRHFGRHLRFRRRRHEKLEFSERRAFAISQLCHASTDVYVAMIPVAFANAKKQATSFALLPRREHRLFSHQAGDTAQLSTTTVSSGSYGPASMCRMLATALDAREPLNGNTRSSVSAALAALPRWRHARGSAAEGRDYANKCLQCSARIGASHDRPCVFGSSTTPRRDPGAEAATGRDGRLSGSR